MTPATEMLIIATWSTDPQTARRLLKRIRTRRRCILAAVIANACAVAAAAALIWVW